MSWQDSVLSSIGQTMGMDNLHFNDDGIVCFQFENNIDIYFELKDQGVLVYAISLLPDYEKLSIFESFFKQAHYKSAVKFGINAGVLDDKEILGVFIENELFSQQIAEHVIDYLIDASN